MEYNGTEGSRIEWSGIEQSGINGINLSFHYLDIR
jgi:hypothetical protein